MPPNPLPFGSRFRFFKTKSQPFLKNTCGVYNVTKSNQRNLARAGKFWKLRTCYRLLSEQARMCVQGPSQKNNDQYSCNVALNVFND